MFATGSHSSSTAFAPGSHKCGVPTKPGIESAGVRDRGSAGFGEAEVESPTITSSSSCELRFAGLMSRWTIGASCAASAQATCVATARLRRHASVIADDAGFAVSAMSSPSRRIDIPLPRRDGRPRRTCRWRSARPRPGLDAPGVAGGRACSWGYLITVSATGHSRLVSHAR